MRTIINDSVNYIKLASGASTMFEGFGSGFVQTLKVQDFTQGVTNVL